MNNITYINGVGMSPMIDILNEIERIEQEQYVEYMTEEKKFWAAQEWQEAAL